MLCLITIINIKETMWHIDDVYQCFVIVNSRVLLMMCLVSAVSAVYNSDFRIIKFA